MRIISGKYRGKKFHPPQKNPARPTTDFAKEGLFNILNNTFYFDEINFLDLFGGTGSISFEMSSRGCEDIDIVEQWDGNVQFIRQTALEIKANIVVHKDDVFHYIKNCNKSYKLIFAGPPYPLPNIPEIPELIFEYQLLDKNGWFVLETNPAHNFDTHPRFLKKKNYGTTVFHFFGYED